MPAELEREKLFVTVLRVRKDARKQFALWQEKMNKIVTNFPGFVSLEMRSSLSQEYIEWTSVQRFKTLQDLNIWKNSKERKTLIDETNHFLYLNSGEAIRESEADAHNSSESVTEVFVTRVTNKNYEAYRAWASKVQQIEAQFPGYQGIYIQAPENNKSGNWITILRFDSSANLDRWLNSEERKNVLKDSESIVEELQSHRIVSPFAGWFANVSNAKGAAPPVWKQTMLILLVLYPIVMLEMKFLSPWLAGFHPSAATFIGNAISVSLVSWPLLPAAIHYLKWWLIPEQDSNTKEWMGLAIVLALYVLEVLFFWISF